MPKKTAKKKQPQRQTQKYEPPKLTKFEKLDKLIVSAE